MVEKHGQPKNRFVKKLIIKIVMLLYVHMVFSVSKENVGYHESLKNQ